MALTPDALARARRSAPRLALLFACTISCWVAGSACSPAIPRIPSWAAGQPVPPQVEPDEQKLWAEARKQVEELEKREAFYPSDSLERYLGALVERLAPARSADAPKLRVRLTQDLELTDAAFAMPDGTIVISLPLLVQFPNEAQLAYLLGHEMAHVFERHSLISQRYDAATSSHVQRMRLSRSHEDDADRMAVESLVRAGYSANESTAALHHIFAVSPEAEGPGVSAWRSHHVFSVRQRAIASALARIPAQTTEGRIGRDEFESAMDEHRLVVAEQCLEIDRPHRARAMVALHLDRNPKSAPAYVLRARITAAMDPASRHSKKVADDLERAVEVGPEDPTALRALGLYLRDTKQLERSRTMLRRYLKASPDAIDRKLVERYLSEAGS